VIPYFPTAGDRHGWAIDEDLRMIREALAGSARVSPLGSAAVVHSPFWMALSMHDTQTLSHRFVIAHADNPPFFYLTQPEFARAIDLVDLWVARSNEALAQFEALGLPAAHIPYAIDENVFQPWSEEQDILRGRYNLPAECYIIGNFHRDSEGSDLTRPKAQKSPEVMVSICRKLVAQGAPIHVLLAGPRRHWIRNALAEAGVPFTFVGDSSLKGDDFGPNIVSRSELNMLYNACDLYLIPSRWEGGPQSVMEAAACRRKILSTRVGVGRDILEEESQFDSIQEACERILGDITHRSLDKTIDPQFQRWEKSHTSLAMAAHLQALYRDLPGFPQFRRKVRVKRAKDTAREIFWQIIRRLRKPTLSAVAIVDGVGRPPDCWYSALKSAFSKAGLAETSGGGIALCGSGYDATSGQHQAVVAFLNPGECQLPAKVTIAVVPSAQDAVNLRRRYPSVRVVVGPFPAPKTSESAGVPCVIEAGNRSSSGRMLTAIKCGSPVVYPDDIDGWFTVFHYGVPYGSQRTADEALEQATSNARDFNGLDYAPGAEVLPGFVIKLATLASELPLRTATAE